MTHDTPMSEVDDYLEHYGVKGMKWGVSRTRAQLAKAREKREGKKTAAQLADKAERAKRNAKVAERRSISDDELNYLVDRISKEKRLVELVGDTQNAGRTAAKGIATESGTKLARNLAVGGAGVVSGVIATKLAKKYPSLGDPTSVANLVKRAGKLK